jgi:uncharacterized lipoprotein NlpE involved in copper resistance
LATEYVEDSASEFAEDADKLAFTVLVGSEDNVEVTDDALDLNDDETMPVTLTLFEIVDETRMGDENCDMVLLFGEEVNDSVVFTSIVLLVACDVKNEL